jgi:putative restriction endonuclease
LAYDAEILLAQFRSKELEESVKIDLSNLPIGHERMQEVKRRINQNFFREAVLSSYSYKCCITGITNTSLLEACHISGWADDENNRTNPKNGLCMTPTFHRAYDKFLMAITPDYEIVLSDEMLSGAKDETTLEYLRDIQGRHIVMPEKFAPEQEFLAQHFEAYRQRK